MRYLSLFTGIGGFELGINQAYEIIGNTRIQEVRGGEKIEGGEHEEWGGLHAIPNERAAYSQDGDNEHLDGGADEGQPHCVGFSEIDKYATAVYQSHFPEHTNYGDITKINTEALPDFELLVGGFPCQSFSIAGKRKGFADTRGTLFFDIARILRAKQPRLCLLENVKGLFSHDNGKTFTTIISTLDELGYDLQWQVLNSKNHGVPQNRERVFIVGHLRGTPRPEVFPLAEDGGSPDELQGHVANTITARYGGAQALGTYVGEGQLDAQEGRIKFVGGIGEPRLPDQAHLSRGHKQPSLVVWGDDIKIRRLTPLECERLQGFPDNWTAGISDTQRYKCCGNAVTVNVIQAIMERLLPVHN